MSSDDDVYIGIDLGTSNSVACVYIDGKPTLIPSSGSASIYGPSFPSYVAFDGQRILVGEKAKRKYVTHPDIVVSAIKKKMGQNTKVKVNGNLYSPQEISAYILKRIKKDAETFLKQHNIDSPNVKNAVITVPAYFDDNQRTATRDAAEIAGFDKIVLINEPTAASLAYGINNQRSGLQKILVFDLGGGTLDVTIMEYGGKHFEVKATSGDPQLGGTDMDNIVFNYLVKEFEKEHGIRLNLDSKHKQRNNLMEASERAKIDLSTSYETEVNLPFMGMSADGTPLDLVSNLNRTQLEKLVNPIVERCGGPIQQALDDAGLTKNDIDKLILVGGPTRMPIVRKFVQNFMGLTAEEGIDPMACVAQGAAIKGGVETGEIEVIDYIIDVIPLSLGIISKGRITEVLVERNTPVPITESKRFWNVKDYQKSIKVEIVQGEYKNADENTYLGAFNLRVKPAPRHETIVEITFEIDKDGILNVTAVDENTGNKKSLRLESSNKMTGSEIERTIKKVKDNIKKDEDWFIWTQRKNEAHEAIMDAEEVLDEYELSYSDKDKLNNLVSALEDALEGDDPSKASKVMLGTKKLQSAIREIIY